MNLFDGGHSEWIILAILFFVIFSGNRHDCCKPSRCDC